MKVTLIIPCFNEAKRLEAPRFLRLIQENELLKLVFIDDGSTDGTDLIISELARHPRIFARTLPRNVGKAEAVRIGLIEASITECDWMGYADADLATPPEEIERLIEISGDSWDKDCVFGSRIFLCGSQVERRLTRHLIGRLFALASTKVLGVFVYDTQAGVKFFRNTLKIQRSLKDPFVDRWSFDVELFGRLKHEGIFPNRSLEVPLRNWKDQGKSKVSWRSGLRSFISLVLIRKNLLRYSASD